MEVVRDGVLDERLRAGEGPKCHPLGEAGTFLP